MPRYLVDVNLPYRFSLWAEDDFVHMRDVGERWSDTEIWRYARERGMVILTKDADFSDRALVSSPPPWVVHFRFGNMRMRDFHGLLTRCGPRVQEICQKNRLVRVYADRIEAIE
jgi:predicted nuclease of predicted toxin-antitoxin system